MAVAKTIGKVLVVFLAFGGLFLIFRVPGPDWRILAACYGALVTITILNSDE